MHALSQAGPSMAADGRHRSHSSGHHPITIGAAGADCLYAARLWADPRRPARQSQGEPGAEPRPAMTWSSARRGEGTETRAPHPGTPGPVG